MTNDDELLKRMDNLSGWLRVRHYADFVVADEALSRICELKAELEKTLYVLGAMELEKKMLNLDGVVNGTHVIVPIEPTEAMVEAGLDALDTDRGFYEPEMACYRAMIAAAKEGGNG